MLNNIEDVKNLILWCKEQKISQVNIGGIACNFHDSAFQPAFVKPEEKSAEEIKKLEDEILYHSSM